MTQEEAYEEMVKGNKVKHEYYTPEEYAFINSDGSIETKDGYIHGGKLDEFWSKYQKWNTGWSIYRYTPQQSK